MIRQIMDSKDLVAIGFRHDFPDGQGRLWRTEAVIRKISAPGGNVLRIRTACMATRNDARIDFPRKPFIVKSIVKNWGDRDGMLDVEDQPTWLDESSVGINLARSIVQGSATIYLPCIYFSTTGDGWALSRDAISKLSYDLGGVAHVAVEPSRRFSHMLRSETQGRNAYGGAIGVAIPGRGIAMRLGLDRPSLAPHAIADDIKRVAIAVRGQMPSKGWDWTELQEQALRKQREQDKNRLSIEENEKLYQEEIENLQDRIRELESSIVENFNRQTEVRDEGSLSEYLERITAEIYAGEIQDRIRMAIKHINGQAEQIGLDKRSIAVFEAFLNTVEPSTEIKELVNDLKRATSDTKKLSSEVVDVLIRYGYQEKSDNKHIRLEPQSGYVGLDNITIPKTPSDHRALENLRKQIERTLGINKLDK